MSQVQARIADIQARIDAIQRVPTSTVARGWGSGLANLGAGPKGTAFSASLDNANAYLDTAFTSAVSPNTPPRTIPPEFMTYGNGNLPTTVLSPIGIDDHRLWAPAADSFTAMRAAAAADGVDLGVTDSYRAYGQQIDLAQRKGLYTDGGLGATPGTSPHGWGVAVDMNVDDRALAWLRTNGHRYNFWETTPREPWHWEYRPGQTAG